MRPSHPGARFIRLVSSPVSFSSDPLTTVFLFLRPLILVFLPSFQIERLVEEESLALNQTVLTNRQAHADLLARLKTREVAQQATWRDGWEADLERWRLLRMRHTLGAFCARMASAEFADPPERNAELGAVKREEVKNLKRIPRVLTSKD